MADTIHSGKIAGMRKELRALHALVPEAAKGFGALSKGSRTMAASTPGRGSSWSLGCR